MKIGCYPDTEFACINSHKKITDLACVNSRTGYVIMMAGYHEFLQSKLQSESSHSTMGGEITSLAHSCKALFCMIDMVMFLGDAEGFPSLTIIHVPIHKLPETL